MAEVTVKQLAQVVGTPVDKLLVQLGDAGIAKTSDTDMISDSEKLTLLTHLRESRGQGAAGGASKRISLKRKRVSELQTDASGRKKVNVEVRARRTYVNPETGEAVAGEASEAAEVPAGEASVSDAVASAESVSVTTDDSTVDAGSTTSSEEIVAEAPAAAAPPVKVVSAADAAAAAEQVAAQVAAQALQASKREAAAAESAAKVSAADAAVEAARQAEAQAMAAVAAATAEAAKVPEAAAPEAPKAPVKEQSPAEKAKMIREAEKRLVAETAARAAAERMAEKQVAAQRRQESDDNAKREKERREQERVAAELQRRAAMEAQQAASSNDRGGARSPDKPKGKGRGKGAGGGGGGDNRFGGRNQLHVAKGKGGRRKGGGKARRAQGNVEAKHGFERPTAPVIRDVEVPETITVAELANKMAVKAAEVIKAMMTMGVMATINQLLDQDTAILVVEEMGHKAIPMGADDVEAALAALVAGDREGDAVPRPPVVAVMGHVDHGKTSLLDYIRRARVASGEAGGITQHIGAYQTETENGVITFLDTPGHAAFTSMRARGAQATDIVVLVVAADDGVMPQTVEGIQHARAAGVPLIIAVNKMDKEGADPERVRNELSQHEVISEEWGGDTQFVPLSALTGEGVDQLLEALILQAEFLELNAVPEGNASGVVIEASLDKGKGPVATILVQEGTLKRGDSFICGQETGRVRAMFDENGKSVDEAGPSTPVQVLGLSATPNAGDEMLVAADEKSARELAELRYGKHRDARLAERRPARMEDVFSQIKGVTPVVNFVVKADVKGSFEAIRESLERLSTDEVEVRIVGGGVGGINESDANLASASGAILVGFNVRADTAARRLVQEQETDLRYYSVIYELIDLAKQLAGGLLAPEVRERIIGNAKVGEVFTSPKFGLIAGCMVVDGVVRKDEPIRVLRENVVIYEGELESLRRFKDDVKEVRMGTECGIGVKNYTDVKPGDIIEVFERTEVARTL
ncbi:translation initiation factor IF-2 [Granulosicoccus antarcticus]|uniref:Translation initiation factor IF-2 n=1 Tax=Granulosicoccus antarcticus IMCC3135 TaxID=1192854 RepID=A0A2Z2NYW6_9GAMM|nr:translation initiation factor IF-2 [Granulosicoccus antarcticus]ASJ72334.1 Translation initiation factor IF-2 [Granulosicoccus antarcticus IMCC3135]